MPSQGDLGYTSGTPLSECKTTCDGNADCTGFAAVAIDDGGYHCWYKNAMQFTYGDPYTNMEYHYKK